MTSAMNIVEKFHSSEKGDIANTENIRANLRKHMRKHNYFMPLISKTIKNANFVWSSDNFMAIARHSGVLRWMYEYICTVFKNMLSTVTMVSLMWAVLSVLVAVSCVFSYWSPNWVVHSDSVQSYGLFRRCYISIVKSASTGQQVEQHSVVCGGYRADDNVDLKSIPAGAWQASTLLFGSGTVLHCLGGLLATMLLFMPSHPFAGGDTHRRMALLCGYMQSLAVLLLMAGLVMFPLGFTTTFFQRFCDSTGAFCVGQCTIGWSYILAITATALAIFCPVLSNYTDLTLDGDSGRRKQCVDSRGGMLSFEYPVSHV